MERRDRASQSEEGSFPTEHNKSLMYPDSDTFSACVVAVSDSLEGITTECVIAGSYCEHFSLLRIFLLSTREQYCSSNCDHGYARHPRTHFIAET